MNKSWLDFFYENPKRCLDCGKTLYVIYQKRTAPPPTPPTYSITFCELEDCLDHCHCHTKEES